MRASARTTLLLDVELFEKRVVTALILALKIFQMGATISNHAEKSATGMSILRVLLKVRRKLVYLAGQKTNLDLRRPGILFVASDFLYDI